MKRIPSHRDLQAAALALLPMAFALAGAVHDERLRLGYSQWRTACRGAGLNLRSLAIFTFELLPGAITGALLGGVLLLAAGIALWGRTPGARRALAAHAGCVLAMSGGLLACAFLPTPVMLGVEATLAAGFTLLFCHRPAVARVGASVTLRTPGASRA